LKLYIEAWSGKGKKGTSGKASGSFDIERFNNVVKTFGDVPAIVDKK
jgi:hypothetical protein